MRRARSFVVHLSLFGVAAAAAGCADSPTMYYRAASTGTYAVAAPSSPVLYPPGCYIVPRETAVAMPSAIASAPSASREVVPTPLPCPAYGPVPVPCAPVPCAPAPVCAPPPCAPVCGLPCETGISDWHVRGVVGIPSMFGTDAGEGCNYWGVDVGTTRCNCVGFDAFYRRMSCDNEPRDLSPGTGTTALASIAIPAEFKRDGYGRKDAGTIQFIGLKVTYQHSFSGNFYGWAGAGPEYFWTQDYLDDDSGFGGFAELGIGWKFASWGALRLGVDFHGDYTSVTRKAVADSGQSRMLWTVAPTIGLEIDF